MRVFTCSFLLIGFIIVPTSATADLNAVEYANIGNPSSMAINSDGSFVAKANGSGVQVSRDYGATWTQTLSLPTVRSVVAMSPNGQYLVTGGVASHDGSGRYQVGTYIYVSSDAGATWVAKTGSGTRAWNGLSISDDGTKILGSVEGIYRQDSQGYSEIYINGNIFYSSNSGTSFTNILAFPTGDNGGNMDSFQDIDMTNNAGTFFAATLVGLYRSTNNGATWSQVSSFDVRAISASSDGSIVYAATDAGIGQSGILKSTDGGVTWGASVDVDEVLKFGQLTAHYIATSADGKYVVIGQRGRYLYESRNYGANFVKADTINEFAIFSLKSDGIVMSKNGRFVYLLDDFRGEVFKATNGANRPAAPTLAGRTATSISLTWSAPVTNGSTISDYLVEYSSNSGVSWTNVAHTAETATARTVTGLTKGTSYEFRIKAVTEFGSSDPSLSLTATPAVVPNAPTSVTGSAANQTVNLSWTAPEDNGGIAISDYLVEFASGGAYSTFSDGTSTNTSATVTGLTNGTAYTFRVSAINAAGTGSASTVSSAVTPITVPSVPQSLSATASNQTVVLNWSAPSSTGGSPITDYVAEYSTNGTSGWVAFGTTSSVRSETATGLTNGTLYYFRVSAVNTVGTGTATSNVTATPSTTASAPTSLIATPGNAQVSLAFSAGSNGGSALTDYVIEYSSNSGSSWSTFSHTATTTSPVVITGLTNYTSYIFRLTPINGNGNGATSSASSAVTPGGALSSITLSRQSAGTAAGAAFSTQPQITLRDQFSGTLLTDSSTVVTATIGAGGTLVGTETVTAVAGVATFVNLGISGTAGTTYTVTYSAPGVTAVTQAITVTTGTATKLRISRNSSGAQTGTSFTTQPIVVVTDSGNNTVTTYQNTTISASVNNSTCFLTAAGDTATATSGSATFSNLGVNGASGTLCVVTYLATNLTSVSETVTVTSGPAANINRTTRPDFGYYGRAFGQQPVYTITDSGGNTVTTDNSTVLTITTPSNSGSTILQETQTAVNGIVTFTNLGFSGINAGTFVLFRVSASSFSNTYTDSVIMAKGDPVLSWSNSTKNSGASAYTVTPPDSNAAGVFSYTSSNSNVATVSGTTISVVGQGTTTLTATLTPTDTNNFNSDVSVTSTLTVTASSATITISLAGGVVTVPKGKAIVITATVNVAGKVKFFANGKVIGGCAAKSATTSATCSWKPAIQGQNVALTALLNPTSGSFSNVRSSALNVGVTRRTGPRS